MLFKWPIRVKFRVGLGLLLLLVVILASSGLYTTYAYRSLVKSLSMRAVELPLSAELSRQVGDLRITLSELRGLRAGMFPGTGPEQVPIRVRVIGEQFRAELQEVEDTLSAYRVQLEQKIRDGSRIADNQREWATLHEIEAALARVHEANREEDWALEEVKMGLLDSELELLQALAAELPSHLYRKLGGFAAEVRSQYRTLIVGTWIIGVSAGLILALLIVLFRRWISRPLRVLIDGSRRVAGGQFGYRIHLDTDDEMAELAEAMNNMTARFQAIRDDLDRQVRERTRQVVRSEQLASVGFLAAGVAHEINNPLAAIALGAESLESRVREALDPGDAEHAVIANYLKMIQSEAFRCKKITERLLDFSRAGQTERQRTELGELVSGVVDMVSHLGKYQRKRIELAAAGPVVCRINPQETKQVVLNLLTNALESLDEGGAVQVRLATREGFAELSFVDDGCGMEPDVLERIFEPFFTRRRGGQGTGLGLSISYHIVSDHGGDIEAASPGPGQGSTFRVRLPLSENQKESENQHRAA